MQHILHRTNTPSPVPTKVRSAAAEEDNVNNETGASVATTQIASEPATVRNESVGAGLKDKR